MNEQQQLAVEIAKDALALLASEKIEPETGCYFDAYFSNYFGESDDVKSTFGTFTSQTNTCEVCALGAILLATTLKKNELTYKDLKQLQHSRKAQEMLLTVLTPHQMALIEAAFEGSYNNNSKTFSHTADDEGIIRIARKLEVDPILSLSDEEDIACHAFYKQFPDTEERFVTIMQNIIDNNGVFTL